MKKTNSGHSRFDLLAVLSLAGAITVQQEQIEWWIRTGAATVAFLAGLLAILAKGLEIVDRIAKFRIATRFRIWRRRRDD